MREGFLAIGRELVCKDKNLERGRLGDGKIFVVVISGNDKVCRRSSIIELNGGLDIFFEEIDRILIVKIE